MKKLTFFTLSIFMFLAHVYAEGVKFSISTDKNSISAGKIFYLEARFDVPKGQHIYSSELSDNGQPTKLELRLTKGFSIKEISWSKPSVFEFFGMKFEGYAEKNGRARVTILAPSTLDKDSYRIKAKASWVACDELCTPDEAEASIQVSAKISEINSTESKTLLGVMFAAFLGGMILNLMPCVFPVIGLKILSFAENNRNSRAEAMISALAYTLGIILTFSLLGGGLLLLRGAGEKLGWGFQLQNPAFTGAMALLFFAMAMSMAGAYEIGASFAGGSAQLDNQTTSKRRKLLKSALSGVLAVLVASPCTAPFMGSAIGVAFAAESSATQSLAIFASLGMGMAFPYVLLSAFPQIAKMLPRPGLWMDVFKQILSIPLFATVIWLVWVYSKQDSLIAILSALLILAVGLRILGMYALPHFGRGTRIFARFACVALIALSSWIACFSNTDSSTEITQSLSDNAWSKERVLELRKSGKPVYVDFTASWCLTCQYNKKVLYSQSTKELFKKNNIVLLTADYTNKNPEITKELEQFGRTGVPLNLLYPADTNKKAEILPAILTESAIIEAIDKIK